MAQAPNILDRRLVYVTGKGGVGRSTVAAALGLAFAARGRRTILCEVAEQDRLSRVFRRAGVGDEEDELTDDLWGISIDPWAALRDWLASQLGSRVLTRVLFENNAFRYFAAAAPGAREMATIVKVWELTRPERWDRGASAYDTVIVDAPASGHGIGMLRTPRTFANLARVGPIRKQADRVSDLLGDARSTAYVAVALPEEMPVNETLELERALPGAVGHGLDAIVVNGVHPRRFAKADAEAVGAASSAGGGNAAVRHALAAARTEAHRSRGQQSQLARLRRAAKAPVVTLPFLFAPELDREDLDVLADELGRKLAAG
jgi:anion-transporting  ArsA/GET3 family ATPase